MRSVTRDQDPALLPTESADDTVPNVWAIVLAGGEGVRLRPLTRVVCGDERPKQYAALLDSRSMLRLTLDRVGLAVPSTRTVVVTKRAHARYMATELAGSPPPPWVLVQPEDRGTAAGVLLPVHWIQHRDPDATVVVFPSDHYIGEEARFMDHVMAVARFVATQPRLCVLLGVRPSTPDTEYGWIGPGEPLGHIGGEPVYRVRQFRERPSRYAAQTAFAAGHLWNTFNLVAKAATLVAAGRQYLPVLGERLSALAPFLGTEEEPAAAIRQAYELAPRANFSRAVLEAVPHCLAVSRLPRIDWSDWGTPQRVIRSLVAAGISPPWLDALVTAADAGESAVAVTSPGPPAPERARQVGEPGAG